ncbi:MFS transporter [uncultured Phenylobacterium sp.]|uniref:MFS transporter n=1 Tax=uncultured Phenylobacterium sp. TaxID=349273 RepID=UPI0025ED888F|nr:MFS transporter [uncultured Phenylobacterium sp.]
MSFFRNVAINRVNLHYAVQTFAEAAGGIFFLAYMLQAGVSAAITLVAMAAIVGLRFVVRGAVLPLARRIGMRRTLIAGTLLEALAFPMLAQVQGVNGWFIALCLLSPLGSALYWTSYHAYFAALGDAEARGGQIAFREAMAAVIGILAPLAGGWALVTWGPTPMFACVGLLQALAALPLIGGPEVPIKDEAPSGLRAAPLGVWLMMTDGLFAAGYHYVWQIALFLTLKQSFEAFAGAMALAALVGAGCGLVLGRYIDLGHGRRALIVAYGVGAGVVVLRALSLDTPWLAVIANASGALVVSLMIPALMTPVYNAAKASPCPLRFHIATEGGWDIGSGVGCLTAAAFVASGQGLAAPILLALAGAAIAFAILWRAYGRPA